MNPGVSEDAARVTSGVVDALRSAPGTLALLLVILGLLFLLGYVADMRTKANSAERQAWISALTTLAHDCRKASD